MSRPLRIEYPGAIYHVTSRGDRREAIYRDDDDRRLHLAVIEQTMLRFDAQVLAYCLMGNHYHLVLHTRQANLSRLMRHLNGVFTQAINRRHELAGHVFQGRFKAILVDRDAYLLALCRYVERNPVAAGVVMSVADWPWSSFAAHAGLAPTPKWLDSDGLHGYVLGRQVKSTADQKQAARAYIGLVQKKGEEDASLWSIGLRQQVFLGDENFVARMQALARPEQRNAIEVPMLQRQRPATLQDCLRMFPDRNEALLHAYQDCGVTMTAIARELGLSLSRVSRLIRREEEGIDKGKT